MDPFNNQINQILKVVKITGVSSKNKMSSLRTSENGLKSKEIEFNRLLKD
ncbi:MAG: hypothetical protein J0L93_07990 [Deltaproteobacteria bacterium]|nr:hypothetical protein [Deltaproteobacteria bacterium]